jgi:GntR family transcriptional regulator / MocR family aminotransferase
MVDSMTPVWRYNGPSKSASLIKLSRPARTPIFSVPIDRGGTDPLFLQISRAIIADVQGGRIRPGTRLPGTRTLADTLKVHRNTVLAAYEELESEGWVESTQARGTYISSALPEVKAQTFARRISLRDSVPETVGFDPGPEPPEVERTAWPIGALVMNGGVPDVRLTPVQQLARAYRQALRRNTRTVLNYSRSHGHPRLRAALATMLATTRGLAPSDEDVLITRGTQMALDLIGRTLIRSGDVVAVEELGYNAAWEAFRRYGAKLMPVPLDRDGLNVDALEKLCEQTKVRAIYVTPHHQYPTMATLTAGRRLALLELARRQRFAIIEDDYDHEFHYEGRPVLPLASVDRAGVVIYVGTLAKILAPGLRLGYVVAPRMLLERLAAARFYVDRQGDYAVEAAVAKLIEDGEVQRHARRARRIYHARRDYLTNALRRAFPQVLYFEPPAGGMAIWAKADTQVDVDKWAERAEKRGVIVSPARRFTFDGRSRQELRLGFAALDETELAEAVKRLRAALHS